MRGRFISKIHRAIFSFHIVLRQNYCLSIVIFDEQVIKKKWRLLLTHVPDYRDHARITFWSETAWRYSSPKIWLSNMTHLHKNNSLKYWQKIHKLHCMPFLLQYINCVNTEAFQPRILKIEFWYFRILLRWLLLNQFTVQFRNYAFRYENEVNDVTFLLFKLKRENFVITFTY